MCRVSVVCLFSVCADGYFEQFGKCVACPAASSASAGQLVGILVLLIAVCVGLFTIRTLLPVDVMKLGLSMLQVCTLPLCH